VLTSYTILVLVRNVVTALDGVPPEINEAALGMGYSRRRRLARIELPMALPSIMAGIRIATVTNVGLVTVAALIGQGGLGALIADGLRRDFSTPLVVGAGLSIALAVTLDLGLIGLQHLASPWQRRAR
jgi:osmoprotectant transport system permease protein